MSIDVKSISILFAAGGTGGHLYPAIAIAEEIKKQRAEAAIAFVGTKNKIEARVVPERGFAFSTIWISGIHRRLTLDNVLFSLKGHCLLVSVVLSHSKGKTGNCRWDGWICLRSGSLCGVDVRCFDRGS